MPLFRGILRYEDALNGMGWTLTMWKSTGSPGTFFTPIDAFNTAYLTCCPAQVTVKDFRVSQDAVYRDMYVQPGALFTTPAGTAGNPVIPLSQYAEWRGYGSTVTQGSAAWKLHGITATKTTTDGKLNLVDADVIILGAAAQTVLLQYRPAPSPVVAMPAVNPPIAFPAYGFDGMYTRKLGRPFFQPGQMRVYRR